MSWNYRVMKHGGDNPYYGLHEVYYNDDKKIFAWTDTPEISADTVKELEDILKMMLRDVKKSKRAVLDYDMEPECIPPWEEEKPEYES